MRLRSLHIRNFRALEAIDVDFDSRVNVIVGPNAIGKTTILEALRLAKAIVAARTPNEPTQALVALGAVAPYDPQRILTDALARNPGQKVEIRCRYELSATEIARLVSATSEIATRVTLSSTGLNPQSPNFNIAFLASAQGKAALSAFDKQIRDALERVRNGTQDLFLDLQFDPTSGRFDSTDTMGGVFFAYLDGNNPPSQTLMSYFPADRALPAGEQPVQLGGVDASQWIESHMSQPQLKYSRLKNTIFNAVVTSPEERLELENEFKRIFDGILKGRKLGRVGINKVGLLSISVEDVDTGRTFEIDGMSSGEKGLILTCLLIGRSISNGGILLLDEPELHLNPAVCRDLLAFFVENYVLRKDLQAIICSHSPEILAGAFESDECSLHHLISEKVISKVHYRDEQEITQALTHLGTSESEGLLYKATVFVEGEHDVELLETGFGDLLRRYKIKELGGRREVEKQITRLQEAEKNGRELSPRYFIFDKDEVPTNLKSSKTVRVLQWDRRCLENYLIDLEVLTPILKDQDTLTDPLPNQGEVSKLIRELAMSQIDEFVARQIYLKYRFDDAVIVADLLRSKTLEEISDTISQRIIRIKDKIIPLSLPEWKTTFLKECEELKAQQTLVWDARWPELCDGKKLFSDLIRQRHFKISPLKLKKRIMLGIKVVPTASWRSIESLLKQLIA
jgi:predicted ATPase